MIRMLVDLVGERAHVLDAGCGAGQVTKMLRSWGAMESASTMLLRPRGVELRRFRGAVGPSRVRRTGAAPVPRSARPEVRRDAWGTLPLPQIGTPDQARATTRVTDNCRTPLEIKALAGHRRTVLQGTGNRLL
jgi:hypothetical protein